MLIPALLTALALTAAEPRPWTCDLAPSVGRGSADEGHIDSISSLNFGCRYHVLSVMGIAISPNLGIDKQMWSVYQTNTGYKNISTYETQDFNLGLRLEKAMSRSTKIYYGLASGQGRGTLNLTQSTSQSSLNSSFSDVRHSYLQHSFGGSYALTENLSLSLAWQHQVASQSWTYDKGAVLLQNVDEDNRLSLASGVTALVGTGSLPRSSSRSTTHLIQIGLSFQFGAH